jgi:hypothetical protein
MRRSIFLASVFLMILLLPAAVAAVGNISVSSTPTGATILLNGSSTGSTTTAVLENIPAGSHTILLQKSGYQDYSQTVTVTDDATSTVSASLTATTAAPTISSITPAYGYNTGIVSITGLTGTGFVSTPSVVLSKSGETNITAASVSATSTQITCTFDLNGKTAGTWNVIVTNPDGQAATLSSGFEVRATTSVITLSSITPSSANTNTTVSITDLAGTNFAGTPTLYLKRSGYNDIPGTVTSTSTTKIVGSFDLSQRTPGAYQVCVMNSGAEAVCGLTFTITSSGTLSNGTITVGSSPTGATVYLGAVKKGTTPLTLYDIVPGTYFIRMQKTDYADSTKEFVVTAGNTTEVFAYMSPAATYTTTATTSPLYTTVSTVRTTKKSTTTVPTPWPSTTTQSSPVGPLVIIGAIGLGFVILRRN